MADLKTEFPRVYTGPIAKFADSGLQQSITKALAGLEPDQRGAVIGFYDTEGTARLALVAKKGKHWSAVGVLEHESKGGWAGEASVRYSW